MGLQRALLIVVSVVVVGASVTATFILLSGWGEGGVEVHGAFFRRGTMGGGVFFIIHNHGFREVCIVAASTLVPPGLVTELHRTVIIEGQAKMLRVDKICVPPCGEVRALGVEGDGHHIMIMSEIPENVDVMKVRLVLDNGALVDFEAREQLIDIPTEGSHKGHGGH